MTESSKKINSSEPDALDKVFAKMRKEQAPPQLAREIFQRVSFSARPKSSFFSLHILVGSFFAAVLIFAGAAYGTYYRYYRIGDFAAAFELKAESGDDVSVLSNSSFVLKSSVDLSDFQIKKIVKFYPDVQFKVEDLGDNRYRITPEAPLSENESYKIAVPQGAADQNYSWAYEVKPTEEPVQVAYTPAPSEAVSLPSTQVYLAVPQPVGQPPAAMPSGQPVAATTPTQPAYEASVDFKIEGSDNPQAVAYNSLVSISWQASGVLPDSCLAVGHPVPVYNGGNWTDLVNQKADGSQVVYAKHSKLDYVSMLNLGVECVDFYGRKIRDTASIKVYEAPRPQSSINIISPNGGQIRAGSSQKVVWQSTEIPRDSMVSIHFKGKAFSQLIAYSENDGSETIVIPSYPPEQDGSYELVVQSSWNDQIYGSSYIQIISPKPQPSIQITAPNGGESYKPGDKVVVRWKAVNFSGINIELTAYNTTRTAFYSISSSAPNTGAYTWVLPQSVQAGDYKILATGKKTDPLNYYTDESDGSFSIQPLPQARPSFNLLSPNGGETYTQGEMLNVTWNAENFSPSSFTFDLVDANNNTTRLQSVKSQLLGFKTTVLDTWRPGHYGISMTVQDPATGEYLTDRSDNYFTVTPKPEPAKVDLRINGSDYPAAVDYNSVITVSWTSSGLAEGSCAPHGHPGPLLDGRTWTSLPASQKSGGSYQLYGRHANVSDMQELFLGLWCLDKNGNRVDDSVSIKLNQPTPSVKVISPNGGEAWEVGKTYRISWSEVDFGQEAIINLLEVSPGGERLSGIRIGVQTGGLDYFDWTIPPLDKTGPNTRRIVTVENSRTHDQSDSYFTIANSARPSDAEAVRDELINLVKGSAWLSQCGDGNYSFVADINKDKIVNLLDFGYVTGKYDSNEIDWLKAALASTNNPCPTNQSGGSGSGSGGGSSGQATSTP